MLKLDSPRPRSPHPLRQLAMYVHVSVPSEVQVLLQGREDSKRALNSMKAAIFYLPTPNEDHVAPFAETDIAERCRSGEIWRNLEILLAINSAVQNVGV